MTRAICLVVAFVAVAVSAGAQSKQEEPTSNSIVGVVVGQDGKPVAEATVGQWANGDNGNGKTVAADEDGHFVVSDLARGAYGLTASSADLVLDDAEGVYYHTGEVVTLKLVKGGVITGKVTDRGGDPAVAVNVRALRIKDAAGKRIPVGQWGQADATDDRGVYRIYGLSAGTYLVVAGHSQGVDWGRVTSRDGDLPTFYPSSTRETASTVSVSTGQEVTGIDISYRGDAGHTVTARVVGENPSPRSWLTVMLQRPSDSEQLWSTSSESHDSAQELTLSCVADGDYEIVALRSAQDESQSFYSAPKRVSVRGADVVGIVLELVPFSSISGKVIVEKSAASDDPCERQRAGAVSEVVVSATKSGASTHAWDDSSANADEKGAFKLKSVKPGLYHLGLNLPDARWYVREIARGDPSKAPTTAPSADFALGGLSIAQGQKPDDLRIVVADGAASLTGRVRPASDGAAVPPSLRVYLLPATDKESADRAHYYSTWARADGTFKLEHLAPGAYIAVVRSEPLDTAGNAPDPAYWDPTARAKLRKGAAKATPIELARCQDLAAFELFAPAPPVPDKPGRH